MSKPRIKIIFYVSSLSSGGAERQFSYIITYLDRKKFDIILCLSKDIVEYNCPGDIKKYVLNKKHFWDFFRMFFRFRKIVLQEKPDIVFTTIFNCNLLALVLKLFYRKKFKLIVRETANPAWYKTEFPEIIYLPFLRIFYPLADLILSPSQGVKDAVVRLIGYPEKQLFIHNMIDDNMVLKFSNDDDNLEGFNKNIPVIVSIGMLAKQKGYEYLLYAFKKVTEQKKSCLIIVGDGPHREELIKLTKQLGISDDVSFVDHKKNPFAYIARSAIFVFPSLFESFGNVLLESMILGVPVVSSRAPYGPEEIIEDGKSGFLVPTRDPDALAEKMLKLLNDPELRQKFSEAGRKRVRDCFLVKDQIIKFENMFLNIIDK